MHAFKDLEQAPPLTLITLRMQDSFTFEVHIIDKRIVALWRARHSFELPLHVPAIRRRRFREHFRKRVLKPGNQKFRLKIDGTGKKSAQLLHLWGLLGA